LEKALILGLFYIYYKKVAFKTKTVILFKILISVTTTAQGKNKRHQSPSVEYRRYYTGSA